MADSTRVLEDPPVAGAPVDLDTTVQLTSPATTTNNGRILLVKFRPTILGCAHFRTVKMLLTEAGQSNGKFCPRSNWKHSDLD